jgi:alkanesulfonate monooxygenase SsuD/methylene tetrahydromethanopterin reductase-like flavin-dependent oxidoreductase (luciferase family)
MRAPGADAAARAAQYGALLDMAAWADHRPCLALVLSQHHDVDDGYLPSPVPVAAAVAARTTTLPISVAALLLALYEPVKLAEDLAVVDLLSRGRVSYVVGIGYRDAELARFGVDRRRRAALVEQRIVDLRRLWRGEEVSVEGRRVRVTPLPFTPGGPMLLYGGGSTAAARRAGRLGMLLLAERSDPELVEAYDAAAAEAGVDAPGAILPDPIAPLTTFVADDPDRAWAELGPHLLADARSYAEWNAGRPATASVSFATTVDELRAERGAYQVLTPDEAAAQVARGVPLSLQPLVGGLPPDLAWPYLEQAAAAAGG